MSERPIASTNENQSEVIKKIHPREHLKRYLRDKSPDGVEYQALHDTLIKAELTNRIHQIRLELSHYQCDDLILSPRSWVHAEFSKEAIYEDQKTKSRRVASYMEDVRVLVDCLSSQQLHEEAINKRKSDPNCDEYNAATTKAEELFAEYYKYHFDINDTGVYSNLLRPRYSPKRIAEATIYENKLMTVLCLKNDIGTFQKEQKKQ